MTQQNKNICNQLVKGKNFKWSGFSTVDYWIGSTGITPGDAGHGSLAALEIKGGECGFYGITLETKNGDIKAIDLSDLKSFTFWCGGEEEINLISEIFKKSSEIFKKGAN